MTTQPETQIPHPHRHAFDLPAATHSYLARSADSLREAMTTSEVPLRYATAHVAALRATAALLAARATPVTGRRRAGPGRRTPGCCWPRSLPSSASGRRSSPPAPPSGRPPSRAPAARSPSGRPTTWSATPTGSSRVVEESLGMTRHVPLQPQLPARRAADRAPGHGPGRRDHVA